jgi:thiosulfate/3-mercaptopyruvate sulfurtransferase
MSSSLPRPLVSAGWLRASGPEGIRLLDMRWYLEGPPGREAYLAGHIPGAVFVDLGDITGEGSGRHPMPSPEKFTRAMQEAGVDGDTQVVVYDDVGGSVAGRLWWLLHYFGHESVAVLDGGLQAWAEPVDREPVDPAPGRFQAGEGRRDRWLSFEETRSLEAGVVLLDARAPERFRGEQEPVDPWPGHIPGARNLFWKRTLGEDLQLLPAAELRSRFQEVGVTSGEQAVVYCGSGVTSCSLLLAIAAAGLGQARLYAGSWSDWCTRPGAPVATGDT